MNKIKCLLLVILLNIFSFLSAEIVEINDIKEILPSIKEDSLVLFDMDDTLTDSSISLGNGAFRQYIRKQIADYEKKYGSHWDKKNVHDVLTFYVASKVPVVPVEEALPGVVSDLQARNIPVFVFTARGVTKWYSSEFKDADQLTFMQLNTAGYDFSASFQPQGYDKIPANSFKNGVLFASGMKKGSFIEYLIKTTGNRPSHVVFIDDKRDQVESVDKKLTELGIPSVSFLYKHAEANNSKTDPVVTTLQLSTLINQGIILNDEKANEMKESLKVEYGDKFFFEFLDSLSLDQLTSLIQ